MHQTKIVVRSLLKSPGFTLVSVLTLALGIGASTAIFSVLYAVLLQPYPYPQAGRIVTMWQRIPQMEVSISWPNAQDWMQRQQAFSALAIFRADRFNVADRGQLPENVNGALASAGIFDVAQLPPVIGRYYTAEEDRAGGPPVVVISEGLWERRYHRDPAVLGQELPVDGVARTLIGVAPAALDLPPNADLWLPLAPFAATQPGWQRRDVNPGLYCVARLRPGLTLDSARADMDRIYNDLHAAYPGEIDNVAAVIHGLREYQTGSYRVALWSLLAATALVLAIACANVAGLFVTRGVRRQRDYAVRAALGASRAQLIRETLGESLLVSFAGGALAVLVAWWLLETIEHLLPAALTSFPIVHLQGWVLGYSIAVAAIAGILAGLWPALRLSRTDLRTSLHEGGRSATAGVGMRRILIGAQVALTLVLLCTTGLILRSLERIQHTALGFDTSSVLAFNLSLPRSHYPGAEANRFLQQVVEKIGHVPGVLAVGSNFSPPLQTVPNGGWQTSFSVEDGLPPERDAPLAELGVISDDYFATLRMPILEGRAFEARDAKGPRVAIIDRRFAEHFWPGEDALGKRWGWGENRDEWFTVVGIVPTVRFYGYDDTSARPQAYLSLHQGGLLFPTSAFFVRTTDDPRALERPIRELIAGLDPQIAIYGVTTLEEQAASTYRTTALQSYLLNLFAGLALLLALTGLYSVVACAVSMRRREIGVRVALGARIGSVVALAIRQGLAPLLAGLATGLAGALAAGHIIRSQLYEVSSTDPLTLIAATLLLALAAVIACYIPARRAAKVDPMIALRSE